MTENEIKALLCKKFAPPVYAFFTEVGTSTGSPSRYIDGIAYSLFQSMGHEIHGFEIKVSRSDFLNELKQPGKSEDAMQYCHRWWLVAPKGVTVKEELPKDWGFMEVVNGKIFKRKLAKELNPIYSPAFMAACLRRSTENVVPRETLYDQCRLARDEARKDLAKDIEKTEEKLATYKKGVEAFEKASGIKILDVWREPEEIGKAVKFVLSGGLSSEIQNIKYDFETAQDSLKSIIERIKIVSEIAKLRSKSP